MLTVVVSFSVEVMVTVIGPVATCEEVVVELARASVELEVEAEEPGMVVEEEESDGV